MKDPDADLPLFKIRHNDMKLQNVKLIVRSNPPLIQKPPSTSERKSKNPNPCSKKTSASNWWTTSKKTRLILGTAKESGSASLAKIWQLRSTTISTN